VSRAFRFVTKGKTRTLHSPAHGFCLSRRLHCLWQRVGERGYSVDTHRYRLLAVLLYTIVYYEEAHVFADSMIFKVLVLLQECEDDVK
jgi:hypothetical protein